MLIPCGWTFSAVADAEITVGEMLMPCMCEHSSVVSHSGAYSYHGENLVLHLVSPHVLALSLRLARVSSAAS